MNFYFAWAEIDLTAIARNVRSLKNFIGSDCRLMAVVKADGYGHGMGRVAKTALENGASALAVARIEEGIGLREMGVAAPILVLGYTPARLCRELIGHDLIQTVWSEDDARAFSREAAAAGRTLAVHFKVDTGMGRLGKSLVSGETAEAVREMRAVNDLPGISLQGVYTHFSSADEADKTGAAGQLALFSRLTEALPAAGLSSLLRHAANSAAIIDLPSSHLDMVRAGIAMYGLYPSAAVSRRVSLEPAMALKTRVIQLKPVAAGTAVSYGATYITPRATVLAIVPIGYAEGYNRLLSSRGHMLVRGRRAPVVGRVCMDLTVLDVGGIEGVRVEDEVVVFGRQGEEQITVDEIAAALNTINYEVVTAVTDRVPRVYSEKK
ncbi:MAG: alanine racemase [Thermodesulfobacteriota bacterium]